jgi:hypothetical protein
VADGLGERVARLETTVSELARNVAQVQREIDGPTGDPERPSIRKRLRKVEGATTAVLELVKRAETLSKGRLEEQERRFKRWHAIAGLTLAFWGAVVAPTITLVLTLRR